IDRSSYDTIQKHASEGGYDLVVMGSRGKDRSSLFRGNTTEKVIRLSSVPVFSVDESVNEQNLKHILVPTDSSDISLAAFPLAVKMAGTFGSEITLFHVLELYGTMSESLPRDPGKEEMVSIYEAIIESLNAYLLDAGLSEIQIRRGEDPYRDEVIYSVNGETKTIPLHCKVVKGISAHYEIESYAQEEYDLVVMATHGYSGIFRLFLGSTAEKVAQYVGKPVLTLRPSKNLYKKEK
ncbi:MAG: universal stress protein, partial [Balneolaceae bacterium]